MADCEYYPCHFEGQDCTWCYCPFYPCLDPATGGKYKHRAGGKVWSCLGCHWVHREGASRAIKERLRDKMSAKELQRLRKELMEEGG